MENIHDLDQETISSLINMFNSEDIDNIRMGLTILNNANFTQEEAYKWINLINYDCTGLHFALFQNKQGFIRARFNYIFYINNKVQIIDDDSTLDNNEWTPYEPHYNDLNYLTKFTI
jgi:hypothetical protein